jgi:tetratricopeptide (TPR) repeat protein
MSDFAGAIKDYSQVLLLDSLNTKAFYYRAISKYNQNDFGGAILDFDILLSITPDSKDGYYYRGLSYYRSGFYRKGCTDLIKAKDLGDVRPIQLIRDKCAFMSEEKEE